MRAFIARDIRLAVLRVLRRALMVAPFGVIFAGQPGLALDIQATRIEGRCVGIALDGEIRRNEAADAIKRIDTAAERCGTRNILIGRMPGGSVRDAVAIGMAIRAREYITAMLPNSQCYSACGLVYLGGVQRYWSDGARFIIHRPEIRETFASLAEETAAYEDLKARLIAYVSDMGANPDYVEAMYAVRMGSHELVNQQQMNAWSLFMTVGLPF